VIKDRDLLEAGFLIAGLLTPSYLGKVAQKRIEVGDAKIDVLSDSTGSA
jgi:hypothetical protein